MAAVYQRERLRRREGVCRRQNRYLGRGVTPTNYGRLQGDGISRDPVGYDAGTNLYSYAGNNPINRVDPMGTQEDEEIVKEEITDPLDAFWDANPDIQYFYMVTPALFKFRKGMTREDAINDINELFGESLWEDFLKDYNNSEENEDKVLVRIYLQQDQGPYMSEQIQNAILGNLKLIDENILWEFSNQPLPPGSELGKQSNSQGFLTTYYVGLSLNTALNTSYTAIGKANIGSFNAQLWPNRFYEQYKMFEPYELPGRWRSADYEKAWNYMGGFLITHEILHSVGAGHVGGGLFNEALGRSEEYNIMGDASLKWLITPPDISNKTRKSVRGFLD